MISFVSRFISFIAIVFAVAAQRRTLIGGNWKCNGKVEVVNNLISMLNNAGSISSSTEIVIAAPSVHLAALKNGLRNDIAISAEVSQFPLELSRLCKVVPGCWSQ